MKSILVVDDDFAMRRGIAWVLRGEGYRVFEADGGVDALRIVREKGIDLAIVDLLLPGRDGIDVAEDIGRCSMHTRILILTAHGDHERAGLARERFGENYLEKSSLGEILPGKVEQILLKDIHDTD